jgi:hypothetical protein
MQEVAYQVAVQVPYEDTERVAVTRIENVEETITVQVPYTTTRTVAVGTQTRYAFAPVGGGSGTTSAQNPTPANPQTAEQPDDGMQPVQTRPSQISFPQNPTPTGGNHPETHYSPTELRDYDEPHPVQTAGWQPRESSASVIASQPPAGPVFTVATTNAE